MSDTRKRELRTKIQPYTQTTYETCLAVCLLQAVARKQPLKITSQQERTVLNYSLNFSKWDFVGGHLDHIAKKFRLPLHRFVDNKPYLQFLKTIKVAKSITTKVQKITTKLLEHHISRQPIICIDAYYLLGAYHYPHWITVLGKEGNDYQIFDTWDGREKTISGKQLSRTISSLRNHLKMCPQMILVRAFEDMRLTHEEQKLVEASFAKASDKATFFSHGSLKEEPGL